jgi:Leucine-rich repeat (LRR) protein
MHDTRSGRSLESLQKEAIETMAHYDECVDALLDAYRTGTPEAMERHYRLTWHRRPWRGMRTYVQVDLGKRAADDIEITVDDARWLVAREKGFEDWAALTRAVNTSLRPAVLATKPIGLFAAGQTGTHTPIARTRDWDDALRELREPEIVGLDAHGQMTDALLERLADMPHLTTLRLGGSQGVTDEGLRWLTQFPSLQHLDLSGTSITDRGMAVLRELTLLRRLSLAWTRITDEGAQHMAPLAHLEHLDLAGSHCGDGAIRALAGKTHLRHFSSGASTTDRGLPALHDLPIFKAWQDGPDTYTGDGAEPNRLFLRGALSDRGIASLAGLDGLYALDIDDSALPLTGQAIAPLLPLAHLASLAFDAKDDAMPFIARLPHLRFLGIQDTPASDRGWQALGASQSIERIWGRRCYGLETEGFLALSRMPRLRNMAVSCRNVADRGIAALPSFPALEHLMPMDIPDAGYRHIGQCERLTSLQLMYCRDTTDAATEHIVGLPQLRRYFASYTQITDRTPALLATMSSLEETTFDSCAQLTDAGIASLAVLPRLRELRVSGRGITSAVGKPFPPGVTVHYSL